MGDEEEDVAPHQTVVYEEGEETNWLKMAGKCKISYKNGHTFEGSINENKKKHGQGKYSWMSEEDTEGLGTDGTPRYYEGEYVDGVRYGKGVHVFTRAPAGEEDETPAAKRQTRYVGDWKDGNMHGIGQITYPSGDVYYGTWRNNLKHGRGSYSYKNGDVYSGDFAQNDKHGEGTLLFRENGSQLKGQWEEGSVVAGQWIHEDGTSYLGTFSGGRPIGQGAFSFKAGNKQHGEYIERAIPGAEDEDDVELIWQGGELLNNKEAGAAAPHRL